MKKGDRPRDEDRTIRAHTHRYRGTHTLWVLFCIILMLPTFSSEASDDSPLDDAPLGNNFVILGTQKGVLPQELRVFLASLRSTGCQSRVVIFSAGEPSTDLKDVATGFGAELQEYDFEALSESHGPINLHRFEIFRRFLQSSEQPFDQVLLCDVRDVFFQEDPFTSLSVHRGIGVAIEPSHLIIGACDVHVRWLTNECPSYQQEQVLQRVGEERRSCAGTTIGTHSGIVNYLDTMLAEAERTVTPLMNDAIGKAHEGVSTTRDGAQWRLWCNDQGMHNVLLWGGKFGRPGGEDVVLYDADSSGLATVGTMKSMHITMDGELMTGCSMDPDAGEPCQGGTKAVLIHQYDRVKELVELVESYYGAEGEVFQTFHEKHGLV